MVASASVVMCSAALLNPSEAGVCVRVMTCVPPAGISIPCAAKLNSAASGPSRAMDRTFTLFVREGFTSSSETETLSTVIKAVRAEKKDLPRAYVLVFDDMEKRIATDHSRETLSVAASALLALATPRFSPFMLDYVIEPFYEKQSMPQIVAAVKEESARWDK